MFTQAMRAISLGPRPHFGGEHLCRFQLLPQLDKLAERYLNCESAHAMMTVICSSRPNHHSSRAEVLGATCRRAPRVL